MSLASFFQKCIDGVAKASADKMGDVLILTSVAGWAMSSAAQIFGILTNKNYTKDQKNFMFSQELADAAINIGSFFVITKSLKALSSKLVSTGKLAPKAVVDFMREKNILQQRGDFGLDLTAIDGFKNIRQTYNGFKCFADSTAAVVGGILSSNIVTPILRNEYASRKQSEYLALNKKTDSIPQTTISYPVKRHTFEDFRRTSLGI